MLAYFKSASAALIFFTSSSLINALLAASSSVTVLSNSAYLDLMLVVSASSAFRLSMVAITPSVFPLLCNKFFWHLHQYLSFAHMSLCLVNPLLGLPRPVRMYHRPQVATAWYLLDPVQEGMHFADLIFNLPILLNFF